MSVRPPRKGSSGEHKAVRELYEHTIPAIDEAIAKIDSAHPPKDPRREDNEPIHDDVVTLPEEKDDADA